MQFAILVPVLGLLSYSFPTDGKSIGRRANPVARKSPQYPQPFSQELPIPSTKKPTASYTDPDSGVPIDFYEVEIKPFKKKLFPNLGDANFVGYDGMFPGPTIKVEKGRQSVVRFVNHGNRAANTHLHGSFSE